MLRSGDWIGPTVGGQPFVEKPPLYYWVSWATAAAASPWLALHDGARLASAVFVLVSIVATAWAARLCWGEGAAAAAVLLFLAPLGLGSHAEKMQGDLALLGGVAAPGPGAAGGVPRRRLGGAGA